MVTKLETDIFTIHGKDIAMGKDPLAEDTLFPIKFLGVEIIKDSIDCVADIVRYHFGNKFKLFVIIDEEITEDDEKEFIFIHKIDENKTIKEIRDMMDNVRQTLERESFRVKYTADLQYIQLTVKDNKEIWS